MAGWLWLGVALGATLALWTLLLVVLFALGRRRDARELARFIPDCIVLFRRLLGDPRVPRRAKVALALLIPYLALPFDLIPDFIPVVGQLDDAILVAATIAYVTRTAGPAVIEELWPGLRSRSEGHSGAVVTQKYANCGRFGTALRKFRGVSGISTCVIRHLR